MDELEQLLNALASPIYRWRMARACMSKRGADKRRDQALADAQKLIMQYCAKAGGNV